MKFVFLLMAISVLGFDAYADSVPPPTHVQPQPANSGEARANAKILEEEATISVEATQDIPLSLDFTNEDNIFWQTAFSYKKHASTIWKDLLTLDSETNRCKVMKHTAKDAKSPKISRGDRVSGIPVRFARRYHPNGNFWFTSAEFELNGFKITCNSRYEDFDTDALIDAVQENFKVIKQK